MRSQSRARTFVRDAVTALVVCVLTLGTLFVVAIAPFIGCRSRPSADRTRLDIGNLENGFKLYHARTGKYPDTATGFNPLLEMLIIDKEPRDAWGNPYCYQLIDGRPVITSFGADGVPGGEGVNADLSNASSRISSL